MVGQKWTNSHFPKLTTKDYHRLYQLSDILSEIESCKENPKYTTLLAYFDSSSGIRPIVNKLPYGLQERWTTQASKYKNKHCVSFPPFTFFVNFVREMCSVKNDPAFMYESSYVPNDKERKPHRNTVSTRKTDIRPKPSDQPRCPIHRADHPLIECRAFLAKTLQERISFLKDKWMCFRCCASYDHMSRDCKANIKCKHCQSTEHTTVMHIDSSAPGIADGGEGHLQVEAVSSKCTTLCGKLFSGRSCGKTLLVDILPTG